MRTSALNRAAVELREIACLDELSLAAGETASLLGILRMAGERLGVPTPHGIMVGLQGLRLWALAIKEAQVDRHAS
jgi:hypothetical protein